VLGVSGYDHDVPRIDSRPSGWAIAGLESLNRTIENIEELYIGVAVKRHRGSKWYRAANDANVGPVSSGEARNSKSVPFGVNLRS
jgi:hypothetical protein